MGKSKTIVSLSEKERSVLQFCLTPRKRSDIAQFLSWKNCNTLLQKLCDEYKMLDNIAEHFETNGVGEAQLRIIGEIYDEYSESYRERFDSENKEKLSGGIGQ